MPRPSLPNNNNSHRTWWESSERKQSRGNHSSFNESTIIDEASKYHKASFNTPTLIQSIDNYYRNRQSLFGNRYPGYDTNLHLENMKSIQPLLSSTSTITHQISITDAFVVYLNQRFNADHCDPRPDSVEDGLLFTNYYTNHPLSNVSKRGRRFALCFEFDLDHYRIGNNDPVAVMIKSVKETVDQKIGEPKPITLSQFQLKCAFAESVAEPALEKVMSPRQLRTYNALVKQLGKKSAMAVMASRLSNSSLNHSHRSHRPSEYYIDSIDITLPNLALIDDWTHRSTGDAYIAVFDKIVELFNIVGYNCNGEIIFNVDGDIVERGFDYVVGMFRS